MEQQSTETVIAYKGFDAHMKCRGFQYEVGQTYDHDGEVKACKSGFHACEYPLDVFNYYSPGGSRFALVEQSGQISKHSDDSKVASSKIKISAEMNLAGVIKAAIEYTTSRCKPVDPESPASATGTRGAASATGTRGAASATGDRGAASATGTRGAASATGDQGAASATGDRGAASATGDQGASMSIGHEGRVKGAAGNALFLVCREEESGEILHAAAEIAGQNGIKPDVWYTLSREGKFTELGKE